MRTILLCLALLPLSLYPLMAEKPAEIKPLDARYLEQHALTRGFMLGRPVSPRPTPDGKAVLFLRAQARVPKMSLFGFEVATGKTSELLSPEALLKGAEEHLSAEEKGRRERMRVSVGGFTSFHLSDDGKRILVSLGGRLYLIERSSKGVKELKTGKGTLVDPKFAPDGKKVSYVLDHDVYFIDLESGEETRLTTGGTAKKTNGLAEFVAQEEMQRFTGYWWSPDSKSLAFEQSDASGVEVWYVADPIRPEQPPHPTFYPRPGKANVKVRVGVVGLAGKGEPVWLEWDTEKYPYLTNLHWQKKGGLTLAVQDRLQHEVVLLRADPRSGKTTPLLTERDPAWVDLNHDKPHWLDDGSFLWAGQGPEGLQLEHREKTGELRRVLVAAGEGFRGVVKVNATGGDVLYKASANPTEVHLFRKPIAGGKPIPLTREPGVYHAVVSKDGSLSVRTSVLANAMPRTTVHRADGTEVGELPSVAENPPFVPGQEFVVAGKGPGFHAVITRPRTFDAAKRYPVVVYTYGGPTHQLVQASMPMRLLPHWLADQGFIVVSLDNRGTPGRGREWEKSVYKKFGSVPLEDQAAGVKALCEKFPEMDPERVGIYGWSFGGYLSAQAVLRAPDVFKAAVAGAPVTVWEDYDTHYTERYLGLPETDATAYKESSLLTYARDLKRPLLLVHGTADDNVYFRHTLRLTDALFREGKEFEVLPLSGLTHMVPDPVVTQRLYGRIAGFFQKHLGKPARARAEK